MSQYHRDIGPVLQIFRAFLRGVRLLLLFFLNLMKTKYQKISNIFVNNNLKKN
jgi:hypothetical protein